MKNPDTHATPPHEHTETVDSTSPYTNTTDEREKVRDEFAELIRKTLGLPPDATEEEVEEARKELYGDAGTDLPDSPAL